VIVLLTVALCADRSLLCAYGVSTGGEIVKLRIATVTLALIATAAPALSKGAPSPAPSPAASSAPQATAPAAVEQTLVPRGTVIVVKTLHGINSYGTEAGAKLTYEVVQDVVVDGYLIAQAGDVAEGTIQDAQEGRNDLFSVKAANLRVSVDSVFNFCGDTLRMDFVRSEFRQRQGMFGSHKDVEIVKGQLYQVPTERPQKVCATRTVEQPLPVPTGALAGDKD
jgi:hypothetical protein